MTTTVANRPTTLRRLLGPGAMETSVFALSLLTGPVVSRALSDDGRGSLAAVIVPIQLVGWMLLLGVPYGSAMLVRRFERQSLIDGAWRTATLIALPVSAALWFLAPHLLGDQPHITVGWFRCGLVGVFFFIPATTAVQMQLIVHGGSWRYSLARSVHLVGYSIGVVALALAGRLTLGSALGSWIGSYVFSACALVVVFRGWPCGWAPGAIVRTQLVTGRPQAVITVATTSLGRIDQVFMAFLSTSSKLGAYAVAATAVQVSLPLAKGLADVVLPDAFASADGDVHARAVRLVFVLSTGIGIVTALVAPWLLPAVFGKPFSASVPLLWILIPGQILFNTAWVISAHRLGSGRPGTAARAIASAAVVNLVLIAPAVVLYGARGAAALTTICQALYLAAVWFRRGERHVVGAVT